MATLHYYLGRSEVQPYVGLGAGAMYRRSTWESGPAQTGFGFCASPQFGVLFTVTRGIALNVLARYVFTTGSFDVDGVGAWRVKYPQWIGLQAGVALDDPWASRTRFGPSSGVGRARTLTAFARPRRPAARPGQGRRAR